eukprot:m.9853 g.9853  ORF g.9853 m.9853 type:complete len:91 (+) comp5486_c0_seq1:392-664(+)
MSDNYSVEPYYIVIIIAVSLILLLILGYYLGQWAHSFWLRAGPGRRRVHPLNGELPSDGFPSTKKPVSHQASNQSRTPGMTLVDVSDSDL